MNQTKTGLRRLWALLLAALLLVSLCACGASTRGETAEQSEAAETQETSGGADTSAIAGDYYLDLTDLGMKLTIYLRIGSDGSFLFSNTTAFEVNKSSGTVTAADDGWLMVYSSVNGEEKSLSDGLTSSFAVTEGGVLDFSSCEKVYYGSASATTTSADNPDAGLYAVPITDDYVAPDTGSDFTVGAYAGAVSGADGISYTCYASFFTDSSYLLVLTENDNTIVGAEGGRYGVSTTQLALTPDDGSRVSCEVVSESELSVSVLLPGESERTALTVTAAGENTLLASYTGSGTVTGTDETFEAELLLYTDGSYTVTAGDFTENGLFVPDFATASYKIYPDHPETGDRGLYQVSSVPAGELTTGDDGFTIMELSAFRVRLSESLNRDKCSFALSVE